MDTELLKTFLEVYRCRHFGKAAETLCVTQSAVSVRIRQLEDQVGVPLFTRDRNNIQPTVAGDRLLRHAEGILTNWNRARMDLAHNDDKRLNLAVGAVSSLWDIHVSHWIRCAYRAQRRIAVTAEVLPAELLLRRLREGTMDVAFLYEAPADPALNILRTLNFRFVMVSSKQGLKVETAMRRNYILVDWGAPFAATHAQLYPDAPAPAIRISSATAALDLLCECGGSAYFPETAIRSELADGVLFRVDGAPVIDRNGYVISVAESGKHAEITGLLKSRT